jgi:outer membrane protein TolC
MRSKILSLLASVLLTSSAALADDLAPERSDRPWNVGRTRSEYVLTPNASLSAVPPPPSNINLQHDYTLPELIDIAQSNNPETRVAWDRARDAAYVTGIVEATYLPNVSAAIVGGYQTGTGRNSIGGRNESISGSISSLSVQWLLFDFGERGALLDAAKQHATAANIGFTAVHQQVIYSVCLAYYAHAAAQVRAHNAAAALKDARQVQAAAEGRFAHGIGTVVEAAQARQATAQAQLAQVQADGAERDTYISLIAAMGISPLTKLRIADISRRQLSQALDAPIEQLVSAALARRTDMQSAWSEREASLDKIDAARAEYLPKVFVAATGSYATGSFSIDGFPGVGGQGPTLNLSNHQWGATVLAGVTIPIYDGGIRDSNLGIARAGADKAEASLTAVRNEAVRQIVSAADATKTSLAANDASQALERAAQTTFDAALGSYQHGVGSITDVTTAEMQLLAAQNAAGDAYSNALSAAAALALSLGTLGSAPE